MWTTIETVEKQAIKIAYDANNRLSNIFAGRVVFADVNADRILQKFIFSGYRLFASCCAEYKRSMFNILL